MISIGRNMVLRLLSLLIAIGMLMGCSSLICRYSVMSHYAWAIEEGYKPEIIVYQVSAAWSMGVWDRHIQIRVKKDGRYLWVDDTGGAYTLSQSAAFPLGKHYWKFTVQEYMDFLSHYKSYVASNRSLSSDEYRALLKDAPLSAQMDVSRATAASIPMTASPWSSAAN